MAQVRSSSASSNQSNLLEQLHQALNVKLPSAPLPSEYKIKKGNKEQLSIACLFKTKNEATQFNDAIFNNLKIMSLTLFEADGITPKKKTAQAVNEKTLPEYQNEYGHVIFFAEQDIQKLMPSASLHPSDVDKTYDPSIVVAAPEIFIFPSFMTKDGEKTRAEQLMQDIKAHTILSRAIEVAADLRYRRKSCDEFP